ncbi:hypothetical protein [Streptomyces erythrochromogenes]|uniref:hypothetical protein n=1 Tax=Streptomyces erythrochromogenes TaxID=285574 RepID=UPI0033C0E751
MSQPVPGTVYRSYDGRTFLVAGTTSTHITAVPVWTPRSRSRVTAHTSSDICVTVLRGGCAAVSISRRAFARYQPVGIARPA